MYSYYLCRKSFQLPTPAVYLMHPSSKRRQANHQTRKTQNQDFSNFIWGLREPPSRTSRSRTRSRTSDGRSTMYKEVVRAPLRATTAPINQLLTEPLKGLIRLSTQLIPVINSLSHCLHVCVKHYYHLQYISVPLRFSSEFPNPVFPALRPNSWQNSWLQ